MPSNLAQAATPLLG